MRIESIKNRTVQLMLENTPYQIYMPDMPGVCTCILDVCGQEVKYRVQIMVASLI